MSLLYGAMGYVIFNYAMKIGEFTRTKKARYLERALMAQKTYWIIMGVLAILGLGLTAILMLLVVMAAV